ncbi:MAG: sigma-54 dependent transcriptional regulator, partial [Planctomycetota bacterium]
MPLSVLVVDDKEMMRDSVGSTLTRAGFTVRTASDGRAALKDIASRRPDAVVTDLSMPGMTGVDLLAEVRSIDDDLPVVLMTAFGTVETAVEAMKRGAFDYITKPFEGDEMIIAVKRAISHAKLVRENALLKAGAAAAPGLTGLERLVGESPAMRKVREQVRAVAASNGTVLITGESGTGKEVVARAVHDLSPRSDSGAFLAVNCAALNESLLESELFGHERGAFTGADKLRKGRFELADRGTLLLDEVSEVSPQIQAKLLRVLQERAFERVGSSTTIGVDVRVVATSNRDLPRAASMGEFRQDLFFRLNVLPINLPALRDRPEDIAPLAEHFVTRFASIEGRAAPELTEGAVEMMHDYAWPGNVRELQNICERAVVLAGAKGEAITRALVEPWLSAQRAVAKAMPLRAAAGAESAGTAPMHAPVTAAPAARPHAGGRLAGLGLAESDPGHSMAAPAGAEGFAEPKIIVSPGDRTLEEIERDTIVATLQRFNGHRQRTAKALGIGVRRSSPHPLSQNNRITRLRPGH